MYVLLPNTCAQISVAFATFPGCMRYVMDVGDKLLEDPFGPCVLSI